MQGKLVDLSHMRLHDEDPVCPRCGSICELQSRKGIWECCDYSITLDQWDIVRLHSSVVRSLLEADSIEYIDFQSVPIEVEHAVSASHLLPLVILQAQDIGEAVGIKPLLTLLELDDEVNWDASLLLPFTIQVNSTGCSVIESINLISAATRRAIELFRNNDSVGTIINHSFFTNSEDDAEAA
jgi:hypothetical protein